ncbi:hypothetical protein V496_10163 [Pseudogymnoascus sp. VKM F-4515 (FW-2607)]|nr:hypothetical protein V496_10163 [Pseudogymnoascus sp. VKM F-4515 (FW-2607)]KFY93944.1 hypothetical protein V498_04154 [Pseudogymnoascus sp. VKM F-4517 (FW-2822)]
MATKSPSGEPAVGSGTTTPEKVTAPEIVDPTAAPSADQGPLGGEERQTPTPLTIAELNAPDGNAPIEINTDEDDSFDSDSALGSDAGSDTTSLTSSVLHYKYENGRTYHAFREGQYIMPNDDKEQDRLDLVHHVWKLILRGELHRAPIPETVQRVLDVGTGTGIWAMEFADEFRNATVIANDLSPIQPTWVPPNLQFETDDAEDEWLYTQPFDYIHIRNMGASIADWPKLVSNSLENLQPGGWIEVQEHAIEMHSEDGEVPKNTRDWLNEMEGAARRFGKEMNVAMLIGDYLRNGGFEDVHVDKYKVGDLEGISTEADW